MKLAFTVTDIGAALHLGGSVEHITSIVEIPDECLPKIVKEWVDERRRAKASKNDMPYIQLTISPVEEANK